MHPDDETLHGLNPHVARAETDRLRTASIDVVTVLPDPVSADIHMPVGPIRHRAGKDTWLGWGASAVGVAVLIVGALAIGGQI